MLLTAFILGLAGSLHCAGMCSPLAFAVANMNRTVWLNRLVYNAGRIMTYGVMGAIVSSIGVALPLEKFQTGLSIGMGVMLIFLGLIGSAWIRIPNRVNPLYPISLFLKDKFSNLIRHKGVPSIFVMGSLNGLLPCGLTVIALTSCLIFPSILDGFYFMITFGLGTLPVMLGLSSMIFWTIRKFQFNAARANAVLLILAGSLLIGRTYLNHSNHGSVTGHTTEVVCQ